MTLSVILPIHDKPPDVLEAVLAGLSGQDTDQLVIVADRASEAILARCRQVQDAVVIVVDGPKGWRSPCTAFNRGLEAVTSDLILLNHSDIVQTAGASKMAKTLQNEQPAVYFGLTVESDPGKLTGKGHAGPLLMGTSNPRAMLFFTCIPTAALRSAGGWDPAFEAGVCYEDDDVVARLWKTSQLPFIWDDRLAAVHITHDRNYFLEEPMSINHGLYLQKHGTTRFLWREEQTGRMHSSRTDKGQIRYDHA